MRLRELYILGLFLLSSTVAAQDVKPILVDRFDRVSCSDIRARLDQFMIELSKDGDARGFVTLNDDDGTFTEVVRRRALFENHFKVRDFDMERIYFVRKSGLPEFGVELWKVPEAGNLAFSYTSDWNYGVSKRKKPFIVYERGFNESECLFPSGAGILADYLSANPDSRGNVVIRCNGRPCFIENKTMILDELGSDGRVSPSRIRFFYVPVRNEFAFNIEYWLLP
jgi:hypothetical protein